jgi:hypothetical protein
MAVPTELATNCCDPTDRCPHTKFRWTVELVRAPASQDLSPLALAGGVAALPGSLLAGGGRLLAGVVSAATGGALSSTEGSEHPRGGREGPGGGGGGAGSAGGVAQQARAGPEASGSSAGDGSSSPRQLRQAAGAAAGNLGGSAMVGRILRSRPPLDHQAASGPGHASTPSYAPAACTSSSSGGSSNTGQKRRGVLSLELTYMPFDQQRSQHESARSSTYASGAAEQPFGPAPVTGADRGILTVTLLRCMHLVGARGASPDPYVQLALVEPQVEGGRPQVQRSTVVFSDSSPRWREKFDYVGVTAGSAVLQVGGDQQCC